METTRQTTGKAMEMRNLGRTGLSISTLGFGGAPIGYLETDQQRVATILNQLLDAGLNFIDTAASYAGSEGAIGKAVSHRRDEFVLVSKCGQSFGDLPGTPWSAQVILATVDRSLKRLRTDHLDVMLLHSCDLEVLQNGEAIDALVEAREAGKIRFVGYSGDNEEAGFAATHPEIAVVETSINIVDQQNIDTVLPLTRQNEIGVIAKRPVANAAWKPLEAHQGLYREYARSYRERFEAMQLRLEDVGADVADWAELALRFTLSQPGVDTAIVGTTNAENARRNLEVAARGPLPDDVVHKIRQAFARARDKRGEQWPGLT